MVGFHVVGHIYIYITKIFLEKIKCEVGLMINRDVAEKRMRTR